MVQSRNYLIRSYLPDDEDIECIQLNTKHDVGTKIEVKEYTVNTQPKEVPSEDKWKGLTVPEGQDDRSSLLRFQISPACKEPALASLQLVTVTSITDSDTISASIVHA